VSEKRELKKKEILKTALKVWKDLPVQDRSLSLVADACGMTKQGFYRYFRNKQEIIDTLTGTLRTAMNDNFQQQIQLASEKPISFHHIISNTFSLLDQHWDLLVFALLEGLHVPQEENTKNKKFYFEMERVSGLDHNHWLWLFNVLIMSSWQEMGIKREKNPDWQKILEKKVTSGFAPRVALSEERREKINQMKRLPPMEQEASRITQAFLSLVEEKGISELSLQELAQQAGMGKSSLYNYFDSKEELQRSVIDYMQQDFLKRRELFLQSISDFPSRLYGHILFLTRYIDEMPAVRVMITELKNSRSFSGIKSHKPMDMEPLKQLFDEGLKAGFISEEVLSLKEQLQLISFCMGAELIIMDEEESPESRAYRIFKLYTQGICPDKQVPDQSGKDERK